MGIALPYQFNRILAHCSTSVSELPAHVTGMWMKNLLIPLGVAFIHENGVIINVEEMKPQTFDAHMAKKLAKYSLWPRN